MSVVAMNSAVTPRQESRMPSPEGVAAGQTATFKLPATMRYHELQLTYTGVTLAQMTEIRVLANGKPIHRYSATERDVLNQFDGRAAAAGVLKIPFDRYNLKNRLAEEETALNCGVPDGKGRVISSLTVEIDIDGAAAAPALSMHASRSIAQAGGPGTVLHIMKHTRTAAGAGELEISDLPFAGVTTMGLNRIAFKPSANDISEVKIDRDMRNAWERTKALNETIQADGIRTPQAGYFIIDKTERGHGGDTLDLRGVTDFRYILTMTGAASITMLVETIGALGN